MSLLSSPSIVPAVEVSRFCVTVSGPNGAMPQEQGYYAAVLDTTEHHPAKRLIKGAFGPTAVLALRTLRRVIVQDYWIGNVMKDAATDAIDARLETER